MITSILFNGDGLSMKLVLVFSREVKSLVLKGVREYNERICIYIPNRVRIVHQNSFKIEKIGNMVFVLCVGL